MSHLFPGRHITRGSERSHTPYPLPFAAPPCWDSKPGCRLKTPGTFMLGPKTFLQCQSFKHTVNRERGHLLLGVSLVVFPWKIETKLQNPKLLQTFIHPWKLKKLILKAVVNLERCPVAKQLRHINTVSIIPQMPLFHLYCNFLFLFSLWANKRQMPKTNVKENLERGFCLRLEGQKLKLSAPLRVTVTGSDCCHFSRLQVQKSIHRYTYTYTYNEHRC